MDISINSVIKWTLLGPHAEESLIFDLNDSQPQLNTICLHHRTKYVTDIYRHLHRSCCDPFKTHKKSVRKSVHLVSKTTRKSASSNHGISISSGFKLCSECYKIISKAPATCKTNPDTASTSSDTHTTSIETQVELDCSRVHVREEASTRGSINPEQKESLTSSSSSSISGSSGEFQPADVLIHDENFAQCLFNLGLSPLKRKKIGKRSKTGFAKRKISQATAQIKKKVCTKLAISEADLEWQNFEKSVISDIKAKLPVSDKNDQVKLLSILPDYWSSNKIKEEFQVSMRLAKKVKTLKKEQGILPNFQPKSGNRLSEETVEKVRGFYEEDDISRMCPGMRDNIVVKINGEKVTKQKRLMLLNLKDAFLAFKQKEPDVKIGLSKFCALKPVWCICANTLGMHNVCVCQIHQNAKLMIHALPEPSLSTKHYMSCLVCNTDSFNCMFHRCKDCPGSASLEILINNIFQKHDINAEDELTFKQWYHTDRTYLESVSLPSTEYTQRLINTMNNLTKHHFITKAQANFYKECKENLNENTAVVVLDFAENYSFVVQDAVQGFHWNNNQATLHPFCIYHKEDNKLKEFSICIISNHASHDAVAVRSFLEETIEIIKDKFPHINHLIYFSDGASSQYKNFKNFSNLCYHEKDFGLTAEWHFYATSHGKGPCDGVGGILKRLATRASLQRPVDNQILTPLDFYKWAEHSVKGIKVVYVPTEKVNEIQTKFLTRMDNAHTIKGTRSFHAFKPVGINTIKCALFSNSPDWQDRKMGSDLSSTAVSNMYSVGSYIACIYLKEWWLGMVLEICDDSDYSINFLHPSGSVASNNSFFWPQHEDVCSVPADNVLCQISPATATGRTYFISKVERTKIIELIS